MKGLSSMTESKGFASLSPTLLARKGAAKPAMRPQLQPLQDFQQAASHTPLEDLGWNDMGANEDEVPGIAEGGAEVVPINGDAAGLPGQPAVLRQQAQIKSRLARRSALAEGRRAAFTLRLDADRHLKLRLASTVENRSGQEIVSEALDRYLSAMPEIEALAIEVRKQR